METYFHEGFQCDAVRLSPGEFSVGGPHGMIVTLLGSCVAACIWDRRIGLGGMNHFMLPHAVGDEGRLSIPYLTYAGRYGANAMEMVINALLRAGAERGRLVAKIFGGASVLEGVRGDIGGENARFALAYLQGERIPVLAADYGGNSARIVHFWPGSGEVEVRYLPKTSGEKVDHRMLMQSERAYASRLIEPAYGSVDLFEADE